MTGDGCVVIVGGGQAAASCIAALRAKDASRPIMLVGEEEHLPYQRPPLSKAALLGDETPADSLLIRPAQWYEGVGLRLGRRVEEIARRDGRLVLCDGERLAYDQLVLCTGSRARRLDAEIGGELAGVHTLRSLADAANLRAELLPGRRILVVGGGYIGLEVAAAARKRGLSVLLVEAGPSVLGRVASAATAGYFRALHSSRGVEIREATNLIGLVGGGSENRVRRAILSDGSEHDVDLVVAGIGGIASAEIAEAAGLDTANGIVIDGACRTTDPNILAAGDCASFALGGRQVRLESVQNAGDQGEAAAASLLGEEPAYAPVPWFWSDQYDTKLQIVGLGHGHDSVVERPGKREGARSIWYFRGESLLAVDAINDPAGYMTGRRFLAAGVNPGRLEVADAAFPLLSLLPARV
ncbi:NAD(P)/FAD-dependent oxidoreductase [Aureimonas glaciei]|uniref:Pyridine nucleotide-disulfide oxidoreductase n=1 Tax=Aureimonas glaciei TaxID=1776957 RepID=A0A916XYI0_9HYPH|nr:FAD-dependent oxidoreductase [Aureimonas glaciei]GGD22132.1 pyridine nucleotide-disulfide oxidoreductase [Aureimonas glaciei]